MCKGWPPGFRGEGRVDAAPASSGSVKYPFYKKHRVGRHVCDEREGKHRHAGYHMRASSVVWHMRRGSVKIEGGSGRYAHLSNHKY